MGSTILASEALDYADRFTKQCNLTSVGALVGRSAQRLIWQAAPWTWTLGLITPVTVTAGVQDQSFTKPADFQRFEFFRYGDVVSMKDLQNIASIEVTTQQGSPQFASYVNTGGDKIRLDQVPPTGGAAITLLGVYKKAPTEPFSLSAATGIDDVWFYVYQEALLYFAYKWADDQRAGGSTVAWAPGAKYPQVQHTGQYGLVMSLIEDMRRAEPMLRAFSETQFEEIAK